MITLVYAEDTGDWIAVYKDGVLIDQGHSFWPHEVLQMLDIEFERVKADAEDNGWKFPAKLADLVR